MKADIEIIYRRLDAIENALGLSAKGAIVCMGCKKSLPTDWFLYEAVNKEDGRSIKPLCGPCIRGGLREVCTPKWRHIGPIPQHAERTKQTP